MRRELITAISVAIVLGATIGAEATYVALHPVLQNLQGHIALLSGKINELKQNIDLLNQSM